MAPQKSDEISNFNSKTGILPFLHLLQELKKRTGWLNMGIPYAKTESIADHMYRMSLMVQTVLKSSDPLNKDKCIRMALVHDMAEAITGDITPDDGISVEEKSRLETEAMDTIKRMLGSDNSFGMEAEELWKEYASDSTLEANFVKDLDKLELIIQAVEYENSEGISFEKWILCCKDKIRHPELQAILRQVLNERPSQFKRIY